MRPLFLLAIFVSSTLGIDAACTQPASHPLTPTARNGQRLYAQSCASCHDAHSTARKSGPGMKNYYRAHRSDADVRAMIVKGKGNMPAFSSFSPKQVDDLIAYLKTL